MRKEEGLKKVRFYDAVLLISFISFSASLSLVYFFGDRIELFIKWTSPMGILSIALIISAVVFILGMMYHEVKRENWWWFVATIVGTLIFSVKRTILVWFGSVIAAALTISAVYYFDVMRKAFKKGEGNYR